MENKSDWDTFYNSGKINDYLNFKSNLNEKEPFSFEPYNDKRIDNKGTESRRI